ncbi:MAG TPA: PAS domain S-box protein, partial [Isosphaeraceae bacterium]|nr:PAS domain S-box protein [Isosphaeraceae bacterium]
MSPPMDADRHQEIARCLFREANDALFLFDTTEHRVLDVNPVGLRLTGMDKDVACRLRLRDLFAGEAPGAMERLIEAYQRTGFYHSREGYTLRREEGPPIPVNVSVSRIHIEPEPIGLVVARDVSGRRKVEEELRASERRYRSLVESTGVVLWTLGPDGRIAALSPAFEAITGWTRREWVGRPLAELLHPDDLARARDFLGQAVRGEAPPVVELRVLGRSASYLILHFILAAAVGEGDATGVMAVARDVTGRRRFEEAVRAAESLRLAKEGAEAANRAKSEFLASLSHEVRTPMTAILGYTDVLLDDEQARAADPARLDALRTIQQNGALLLSLVDD